MPTYPNIELSDEKLSQIDDLVDCLSLEEKARLISGIDFWHTFAIHDVDRNIDLPSIRLSDGPNGLRGTRFYNSVPSACFPNGTSLVSTFNKELLYEAGKLMGKEAKHKGAHVILGPTVNIQRGPNGGRGFESFSEDPTASGLAASEIIKGIQSEDIIATIKHFVCNDFEDQRRTVNAIVSERALREVYLKPFQLALKHANPYSIMTSYNKVNNVHASQNYHLLTEILRNEWNYQGTTISDWFGTYNLHESISNGLDLEMPGQPKIRNASSVADAIVTKEIKQTDLDERVKNVVKLVERAKGSGIPENAPEKDSNNNAETSKFLRKLAAEGIVLLKNKDSVLPLQETDSIAVIGPNAKYASVSGGGSASLNPYYTTTAYNSIAEKYGKQPPYTVGAYAHKNLPPLDNILTNPRTGKPGFNIKYYYNLQDAIFNKDNHFHEDDLNDYWVTLFDFTVPQKDEYYAVVEGDLIPEESGLYDFGLLVSGTGQLFINGKLLIDNKTHQVPGETFFGSGSREEIGSISLLKGTKYKLRIEFGSGVTSTLTKYSAGSGGAFGFGAALRIDEETEIQHAVEIAKSVDKPIVVIGLNKDWESEGFDRKDLNYPGKTNALVQAVAKANPNTIVVNQSGTPVEIPWIDSVKGLVQSWFNGIEQGNALADVLFGDVNPSGKLSLTFPKKFEDNPAYLNFSSDFGDSIYGEDIFVGYKYYEKVGKDVLFPFGFGLSYTEFKFTNLAINANLKKRQAIVNLDVTNVGSVAGAEVVQVYVLDSTDNGIRKPLKELRDFTKIFLEAGEQQQVEITLDLKEAFAHWDNNKTKWAVDKGTYTISVGNSSDNILLSSKIEVNKGFSWLGL